MIFPEQCHALDSAFHLRMWQFTNAAWKCQNKLSAIYPNIGNLIQTLDIGTHDLLLELQRKHQKIAQWTQKRLELSCCLLRYNFSVHNCVDDLLKATEFWDASSHYIYTCPIEELWFAKCDNLSKGKRLSTAACAIFSFRFSLVPLSPNRFKVQTENSLLKVHSF